MYSRGVWIYGAFISIYKLVVFACKDFALDPLHWRGFAVQTEGRCMTVSSGLILESSSSNMAQICRAVLAARRCRVTPVARRCTGLRSFTISCGPLSLNCSRPPEAPEGKPRWVIAVGAGNYCCLAEISTAVQRNASSAGGRWGLPADDEPVQTLKGHFNSGRCRVRIEYYSPTTQTWLFSWSKHLHPPSLWLLFSPSLPVIQLFLE